MQLREATKSDGVLPGSRTQRWKLPGITAVTPFSRGGRDYYFQSVFADFASGPWMSADGAITMPLTTSSAVCRDRMYGE